MDLDYEMDISAESIIYEEIVDSTMEATNDTDSQCTIELIPASLHNVPNADNQEQSVSLESGSRVKIFVKSSKVVAINEENSTSLDNGSYADKIEHVQSVLLERSPTKISVAKSSNSDAVGTLGLIPPNLHNANAVKNDEISLAIEFSPTIMDISKSNISDTVDCAGKSTSSGVQLPKKVDTAHDFKANSYEIPNDRNSVSPGGDKSSFLKETNDFEQDFPDEQRTSTPKIPREIKQLEKMKNESKILTDFFSDSDTKTRKAKKPAKHDDADGDSDFNADRSSSHSSNRNLSPSEITVRAEKSRRNMRSQNAEFTAKHQKFLRGIQRQQKDSDSSDNSDEENDEVVNKAYLDKSKIVYAPPKPGWDKYCWICHQGDTMLPCSKCIRSYHMDCLKRAQIPKRDEDMVSWRCPECVALEAAEERIGNKLKLDQLCIMLRFALNRLQLINGVKSIIFPTDKNIITNEMNFTIMEENINATVYTTTESFTLDAKWILHNFIISQCRISKLLAVAKLIFKICKQEMHDIETCSECYYNANIKKYNWFVEVCSRPHLLLWAKLKGFPYWPAKAMGHNAAGMVDVRFFGDHDRAWIPIRDCYVFSKSDPNPPINKSKRNNIADSLKEVDVYIKKVIDKFGGFVYAPAKEPYDTSKKDKQLEKMIPNIRAHLSQSGKSDLSYKIIKTADNQLSIIKKPTANIKNASIDTIAKKKGHAKSDDKLELSHRLSSVDTYQMKSCDSLDLEHLNTSVPLKITSVTLKRKSLDSIPARINSSKRPRNRRSLLPEYAPVIYESRKAGTKILTDFTKTLKVQDPLRLHSKELNKQINISPVVVLNNLSRVEIANKSGSVNCVTVTTPSKAVEPAIADSNIRPRSVEYETTAENAGNAIISNKEVQRSLCNAETNKEIDTPKLSETDNSRQNQSKSDETLPIPIDNIKLEMIEDDPDGRGSSSTIDNSNVDPLEILTNMKIEPLDDGNNEFSDDETVQNAECSNSIINGTTTSPIAVAPAPPLIISQPRTQVMRTDISLVTDPIIRHVSQASLQPIRNKPMTSSESRSDVLQRVNATYLPNMSIISNRNNITMNGSQNMNTNVNMVCIPMITNQQHQRNDGHPTFSCASLNNTNLSIKRLRHLSPPPLASVSSSSNQMKTFPPKISQPTITAVTTTTTNINKSNSTLLPISSIASNSRLATIVPVSTVARNIITETSNPIISIATSTMTTTASTRTFSPATATATTTTTTVSTTIPALNFNQAATSVEPETQHLNTTVTTSITSAPPSRPSSQHILGDSVAESLASAVTDVIVRRPPALVAAPIGPFRSDGLNRAPRGPVSKILEEHSHKLADCFRSALEEALYDLTVKYNCVEAENVLLRLKIENHSHEIEEMKKNTDSLLSEMRKNLETEKLRECNEIRKQCEVERIRSNEAIKEKTWCIICKKDANFYCCWNTSYCSFSCQQVHWPNHESKCTQIDTNKDPSTSKKVVVIHKEIPAHTKEAVAPPAPRIINQQNRFPTPKPNVVKRLVPISKTRTPNSRYTIIHRQGNRYVVPLISQTTISPMIATRPVISSATSSQGIILNSSPSNVQASGESLRITPD